MTMDQPVLVSVIIPAYNAERTIAETLDSVLSQSYGNVEVLVVDDGSTDRTAEIVRQYQPRVSYFYQENSGSCAVPRNTGILHSRGELLSFIDADDLMTPSRIGRQVDFLTRHPSVALVISDYQNFSSSGMSPNTHFATCRPLMDILGHRPETVLDNALAMLVEDFFGIAGSFMMRRNLLERVPGFEPTLRASEDFHFLYRLARHTPVGVINDVGMHRRMHESNMTGDSVRMMRESMRACSMLRETETNPEARRRLRVCFSGKLLSWARHQANSGHFLTSAGYYCRGLWNDFGFRTFHHVLWGIARTFAIALRLHSPRDF
jgi:glycosyltransferase involved in cell wall biosynthesis